MDDNTKEVLQMLIGMFPLILVGLYLIIDRWKDK